MKQDKRFALVGVVLILLLWSAAALGQSGWRFRVVAHKDVPADTITLKQLSKIFLKKQIRWKDDTPIDPVDLVENASTREQFSQKVHRKKVSKIKAYWQKQIFTGRGVPPPEKRTAREVLEYVESHPGGIGYVPVNVSLKQFDVKVIKVVAK